MSRWEAFKGMRDHHWLGRAFAKLTVEELAYCQRYIQENDGLSKGAFQTAVNRMFLDRAKSKNHTVIMELLSCANTVAILEGGQVENASAVGKP